MAEIHDVLKRAEIRRRFSSLTDAIVDEFVAAVRRFGHLYPEVRKHFTYPRDPKDEPYLNLAIEAQARYLASRDNDILDLRNSTEPAAVEFRQKSPSIHILEPLEFLREVRREVLRGENLIPPRSGEPGLER